MKYEDIKKIEMKAIIHSEELSEETNCYSASIYINGKKAISVSNRGHGGCDHQDEFISGSLDAANEYCKRNMPATNTLCSGVIFGNLEDWSHKQVTRHLIKKDMNKALKRSVWIYSFADKELIGYPFRQKGIKFSLASVIEALKSKYPQGFEVINSIEDKDEQLEKYIKYADPEYLELEEGEFMPEFDENGECTNIPEQSDLIDKPGCSGPEM